MLKVHILVRVHPISFSPFPKISPHSVPSSSCYMPRPAAPQHSCPAPILGIPGCCDLAKVTAGTRMGPGWS